MDRFSPTGKVSKKRVHLLRWSSFFGRTGLNFGRMDRAHCLSKTVTSLQERLRKTKLNWRAAADRETEAGASLKDLRVRRPLEFRGFGIE